METIKNDNIIIYVSSYNNYDMLEEGRQEKEKLENELYTGSSPGLSDAEPALFLIG